MTKEDRAKLYPNIGNLFPEGLAMLKECSDHEEVQRVVGYFPEYKALFADAGTGAGEKTLEDRYVLPFLLVDQFDSFQIYAAYDVGINL